MSDLKHRPALKKLIGEHGELALQRLWSIAQGEPQQWRGVRDGVAIVGPDVPEIPSLRLQVECLTYLTDALNGKAVTQVDVNHTMKPPAEMDNTELNARVIEVLAKVTPADLAELAAEGVALPALPEAEAIAPAEGLATWVPPGTPTEGLQPRTAEELRVVGEALADQHGGAPRPSGVMLSAAGEAAKAYHRDNPPSPALAAYAREAQAQGVPLKPAESGQAPALGMSESRALGVQVPSAGAVPTLALPSARAFPRGKGSPPRHIINKEPGFPPELCDKVDSGKPCPLPHLPRSTMCGAHARIMRQRAQRPKSRGQW